MRVLLPCDWREWPAEKTKVVLAHELAHARRYDPAMSLIAAINKWLTMRDWRFPPIPEAMRVCCSKSPPAWKGKTRG